MKINRNNYEAFFIDYLESNLDEKLVDEFIEFLQKNPDLKEELSLFEPVPIGQEEITFNKKESLKKNKYDSEEEFNKAAIAALEGDILEPEKAEFDSYLSSHPEKQKETRLFALTKLQPDESVIFNKKHKVYRRPPGRILLHWTIRVAAVVIFTLTVFTFIDNPWGKFDPGTMTATFINENTGKKEIPDEPIVNEAIINPESNPFTARAIPEPLINHAKPKPLSGSKLNKNLAAENNTVDLSTVRNTLEIPARLISLTPVLYAEPTITSLVSIKTEYPRFDEIIQGERLLVDVVREKTGIGDFNFNKITRAGLSLVSSITKEKFTYETNSEGQITEINYDSRILAFSFPAKNEINGE